MHLVILELERISLYLDPLTRQTGPTKTGPRHFMEGKGLNGLKTE